MGLVCQFLLLPALTVPLALAVAPTPSMALGMILVASCPGGNVSNVLTQLAGGRVTVSVGMTAVSTLAAVVITPLNLTLWGSLSPATADLVRSVALDPLQVGTNVALVLAIPCLVGMTVAHRGAGGRQRPAATDEGLVDRVLRGGRRGGLRREPRPPS